MPQSDAVLDDLFDTSSDTFTGGYANVPGGDAKVPDGYANVAQGYANVPHGAPDAPAPVAQGAQPPSSYANIPGTGQQPAGRSIQGYNEKIPAGPRTVQGYNQRIPAGPPTAQGYNQKVPAAPGLAGRVHVRGGDLTLGMDEHYKGEEYRPDPKTRRVIKYVADAWQRWDKYGVRIASPMTRRGVLFDTEAVKRHFFEKNDDAVAGALFGKSRSGENFPFPQEWVDKGMIWVCMRHPVTQRAQFYSHVAKRRRTSGMKGYNFSHSSLSAGGEVIAAGEWIVEGGKLARLSANSGHYQPTLKFLHQAAQLLKGVIDGGTLVYVYDHVDDKWVDYPALKFLVDPTGGGRYWAHPRAQG
jgi:hypothetical protein